MGLRGPRRPLSNRDGPGAALWRRVTARRCYGPPMVRPSSQDLHPSDGARFAFSRTSESPVRYDFTVYLPGTTSLRGTLDWDDQGGALLTEVEPRTWSEVGDPWVRDEALKLARVLKRDPKSSMTRWRGR